MNTHYTRDYVWHGLPYSSTTQAFICVTAYHTHPSNCCWCAAWRWLVSGCHGHQEAQQTLNVPNRTNANTEELARLRGNAGPSTNTLAQHWANVLPRCRVWCDRSETWQTYSVGLMFGQRLRRWTSIEPTAGKSFFLRRRDCRHSTQWHWQWHQVRESLTNKLYRKQAVYIHTCCHQYNRQPVYFTSK